MGWAGPLWLGWVTGLDQRPMNYNSLACYSSKWIIIHCYCNSELNCEGERRGTTYLVQQGVAGDDGALCWTNDAACSCSSSLLPPFLPRFVLVFLSWSALFLFCFLCIVSFALFYALCFPCFFFFCSLCLYTLVFPQLLRWWRCRLSVMFLGVFFFCRDVCRDEGNDLRLSFF